MKFSIFFFLSFFALCRASPTSRNDCLNQAPLVCNVVPTENSKVHGRVIFRPVWNSRWPGRHGPCLVKVRAQISGLTHGLHGVHIHTYGDLTGNDGNAAAGHYTNPEGEAVLHGLPNDRVRHWGDFGNLRGNRKGIARFTHVDRVITMEGIVGRGMIVHALEDVGAREQPTGGAGGRIGHCVIGFANPELL